MASFLDIKLRFRKASGRYDLIDSDGSLKVVDGDRFIQAGIRYLEDRIDNPITWQPIVLTPVSGSTTQFIAECAIIKSLFVTNTSGSTVELKAVPYSTMLEYKSTSTSLGTPAYYTIIPGDSYYTVSEGNMGILVELYPGPDTTYTYGGIGKLYSPQLVNDEDTNYWTVHYPEVAVWAACYMLEILYRNTEGANDWQSKITEALHGIDANVVEQMMPISVVMGG